MADLQCFSRSVLLCDLMRKRDVFLMQVFRGPQTDVESAGSSGVQVPVEVRVSNCYAGAPGCQSAKDDLGAPHIHRLE